MITPDDFMIVKADFLRVLGIVLHCVVELQNDENGNPWIEPVYEVDVSLYPLMTLKHVV